MVQVNGNQKSCAALSRDVERRCTGEGVWSIRSFSGGKGKSIVLLSNFFIIDVKYAYRINRKQ